MKEIEFCRVTKQYPRNGGYDPVLQEIDLQVGSGEFVSVVGPGSAGKTTLLRLVAGLEKPTSGRVLARGEEIRGPSARRGFIFEEALLFPWMTVLQNATFGLLARRVDRREAEEKALEWLRFLGLGKFVHKYPHQLSGGMQRRVAIARVIANDPDVLLCDEPFAGVDWITRQQVLDELLKVWYRSRKTIVYVTHALEEAVYASQRIILLSARPASVSSIFTVDLPERRWEKEDLRFDARFARYVEQVREAFQAEAQRGRAVVS